MTEITIELYINFGRNDILWYHSVIYERDTYYLLEKLWLHNEKYA